MVHLDLEFISFTHWASIYFVPFLLQCVIFAHAKLEVLKLEALKDEIKNL